MAIDKHNFWDSNFYNHPALTADAVNEAEKLLGIQLPSEFIELLNVQNGGYTKGFAYPTAQPTSWAKDHVPLSELFGIVAESSDTAQSILLTAYMTEEWGLPEKQVLLCGDGHWWITLDYRKGEVPTVSWIDTEVEQDMHIADSFVAFLDGLVSEDTFAE